MDFKKSRRKPSEVGRSMMLLALQLSRLLLPRPVRNDDQPPIHHLAPISTSMARSRESRIISSTFSPIHNAMLSLGGAMLGLALTRRRFSLYHSNERTIL